MIFVWFQIAVERKILLINYLFLSASLRLCVKKRSYPMMYVTAYGLNLLGFHQIINAETQRRREGKIEKWATTVHIYF